MVEFDEDDEPVPVKDNGKKGKDPTQAIKALMQTARTKLETTKSQLDANSEKVQLLKSEFKTLKRQNLHLAKQQQGAIQELEAGLTAK
mmetsp:Transcript_17635/g.44019  ORF Transcript_17635/g.44019 Transcript_17635/m.44019 type:complete len:88 (-) Transcript_17635:251-514(-)|eukprot:CAMPEP_0178987236 /NCGR_PEP_ID=MMETSP0795-20121207/3153_1 /TAXON_ID=88552 /ORGANISM="Amoebophrya sp., Strain Ameob2" /LENGTH=87 /DNA_ID=CAMNT_0020678397 /DNA_START=124 /DNA_END=387 /DNA_ORIENTATION=-